MSHAGRDTDGGLELRSFLPIYALDDAPIQEVDAQFAVWESCLELSFMRCQASFKVVGAQRSKRRMSWARLPFVCIASSPEAQIRSLRFTPVVTPDLFASLCLTRSQLNDAIASNIETTDAEGAGRSDLRLAGCPSGPITQIRDLRGHLQLRTAHVQGLRHR